MFFRISHSFAPLPERLIRNLFVDNQRIRYVNRDDVQNLLAVFIEREEAELKTATSPEQHSAHKHKPKRILQRKPLAALPLTDHPRPEAVPIPHAPAATTTAPAAPTMAVHSELDRLNEALENLKQTLVTLTGMLPSDVDALTLNALAQAQMQQQMQTQTRM